MHDTVEVALADVHACAVREFGSDAIAAHVDNAVWSRHGPSGRMHSVLEVGEADAGEKEQCDYETSSHKIP